jgi:hypothetical protein
MQQRSIAFAAMACARGALVAGLLVSHALAQSGGGYDLSWSTIDGGGGTSSDIGGIYSLAGTIGQPDAGSHGDVGDTYDLDGGFWAGVPVLLLGDCKIDGTINLFDVLEAIDIVLQRKTPTGDQTVVCDPNCDGLIDLFDVLLEIDALLGRIPQPLECPVP